MYDYNGVPMKMPDDPGVNGVVGGHRNYTPMPITKSSPVSLSVLFAICGALVWMMTTMGAIESKISALPMIQQDIREMKQMLSRNDGVDMRQDAEIRATVKRLDRHEVRFGDLEKGGKK